jgi:hypothetical protein
MTKGRLIIISLLIGIALTAMSFVILKKQNVATGIIFIGDSHAIGIGEKVKGTTVETSLSKVGWNLKQLTTALNNYSINKSVSKVFISIGTNEGFAASDKIEDFVSLLQQKFPNATFYIFKGSYGWSGKYENLNAKYDLIPFYQRFEDAGVNVLDNGLGYFSTSGKAHSVTSTQAIAIINEINNIITNG